MPISGEMARVAQLIVAAALAAIVSGAAFAVARSRPETVLLAHGIPHDAVRARQVALRLPAYRVSHRPRRLHLRPVVVHPRRVVTRTVSPAPASPAAAPRPATPRVASAPRITGEATAGSQLAASSGRFAHARRATFSRVWLRCNPAGGGCNAIPDAAGTALVLGDADVGHTIRVAVTATLDGRSATGLSDPTPVVAAPPSAPSATTAPSILGFPEVGSDLTASPGVWTPSDTGLALQWQRCDDAGCLPIAGATATTYTVAAEDGGFGIRLEVTATNDLGTTVADSAPVQISP